MGAALNSLLDETKADGTYKRIFDEVASNTTETLGCAPQVPFETPEAHNLFLAVWYGHFFLHTTPCLPSHHSSRGRPHWVMHFNAHAFSPPS